MAIKKAKVGVIGCGSISAAYFKACKIFEALEVVSCADLDAEKAKARAAEFGVPRVYSVKDLLADPEVEIVINLTVPKAHAEIDVKALEAGKHVFSEKPFSISRKEGKQVVELAKQKNLKVGSAPDTFMGGGVQTCRKLIDDGWIGRPVGVSAFMMCHGHESWHPSPEFYYEVGGGPMFDMGPYYLTALVNLLGPVKRVTGATKITFPKRLITSQPKCGKVVKVEIPTHVTGIMEFANGAIGTITTSFDVWAADHPCIEIYGTEGSIKVPDPNGTGGPVWINRAGSGQWSQVPLTHGYTEGSRGVGVADMAVALRTGRAYRANGNLAMHVVDIMESFHDAAREGRYVDLTSTCDRPAALPLGLRHGQLDE